MVIFMQRGDILADILTDVIYDELYDLNDGYDVIEHDYTHDGNYLDIHFKILL